MIVVIAVTRTAPTAVVVLAVAVVGAAATVDVIITGSGVDGVLTIPTGDGVVAYATVFDVVPAVTPLLVVARTATDGIVARAAVEFIVARVAPDLVAAKPTGADYLCWMYRPSLAGGDKRLGLARERMGESLLRLRPYEAGTLAVEPFPAGSRALVRSRYSAYCGLSPYVVS